MDPHQKSVVDLWVKALRSGEYEQGRGKLAHELPNGKQTFCCLGVLCELAVQDGIVTREIYHGDINYDGHREYLPESIREWVGLQNNKGEMDDARDLAVLNDDQKMSFSEIADLIDSRPAGLFVEIPTESGVGV